jgi:hypothetical protein
MGIFLYGILEHTFRFVKMEINQILNLLKRLTVELSGVSQPRHFTPANRFVLADIRSNSVLDALWGFHSPAGPNLSCCLTLAQAAPVGLRALPSAAFAP